jgi:hypothetical protein
MTIGDVRQACQEAKIGDSCILAVYDDNGMPYIITAACFDPTGNVLMLKTEPVPGVVMMPKSFVAWEDNL